MKIAAVLIVVVTSFSISHAQRSVSELEPAHAAALKTYLASHKNVSFRPESILDDEYLKSVRDQMGKTFKPNYAVGDFNKDRRKDFAVLLKRTGKRVSSGATSVEHEWDYPLRLVVFNNTARGFTPVFTQDLMGPLPALISVDGGTLNYGVWETDSDNFSLKPTRTGYRIQ